MARAPAIAASLYENPSEQQDTPAVAVTLAVRRFGRRVAVQDVTMSALTGQVYGLLGPNGSGKSTLLRLIAGVIRPDAGTIDVLGRKHCPEVKRDIGYMSQSGGIHPPLSTWENIRLFAGLQGVRSHDQMREAIDAVGLTNEMHEPVERLSGGMQRRASFAIALAHRPRLLLLDEPTVGLDPPLRVAFWDHFARLNRDGVTVVITTHLMDEAERCHRVAVLRDARLVSEGSPQALKERAGAETMEQAYVRLTQS